MTVQLQWKAARKAAGIDPRIVLYLTRHEFAHTFLKNGGDIATLMKIMEHNSIAVTSKYLHPDIEGAADIINRRNRKGLSIVKRA